MNTLRHSLRLRLAVILVGVTAGIIIIGTFINSVFLGNYYITTKQEELVDMYDRVNRMYPGIEPQCPALQADSLPSEPTQKPPN